MDSHIKLGQLWGVPIGLHRSWFLIFVLVTVSLATGYIPLEYPELPAAAAWILGALTGILFFASVLAHELGHVWVALRERVPVRQITLFLFGGVAQIEEEARSAGAEFRIAIAGPLVSVALALVFGGLYLLDRSISAYLAAPSIWLARINLLLALFNMIPGFPLDGGRVLRAAIWQVTGSQSRATRLAGGVGQFVAYGFIGLGVLQVFSGGLFNGLWLVFIGWFLQNAARNTVMQNKIQDRLRGLKVAQVMARDFVPVPHWFSLKELVEDRMMLRGQRYFFVADGPDGAGFVTPHSLTTVPREAWKTLTVGELVASSDQEGSVDPSTDIVDALMMMDQRQLQQLPVVENQQVVGVLLRDQILNTLRVRAEFGHVHQA